MQEVFRAIGRLSQSNATVLITGESGTGKELVARALHRHSPRAAKPFIAINTAAMPEGSARDRELFGHERGAFTGAQAMRRGRFEQAEGGTLFLDEIGDMPPDLQTRLLRVLSDGQFYRVGGHQPIKANVRVIAATHQDLEARVREGTVPRGPVPPPQRDPAAAAVAARAARGHSAARAPLSREERARARRRGEAAVRGGAEVSRRAGLAGQRAPARERVPLADRDGARARRSTSAICRPSCATDAAAAAEADWTAALGARSREVADAAASPASWTNSPASSRRR